MRRLHAIKRKKRNDSDRRGQRRLCKTGRYRQSSGKRCLSVSGQQLLPPGAKKAGDFQELWDHRHRSAHGIFDNSQDAERQICSYLGLARRAGKVLTGYKTCAAALGRGSAKLIILAGDTSQNTRDKFSVLCERRGVPFKIYSSSDELSAMAGLTGRGIFGITDVNFAEAMIKEIENEQIMLNEE